MSRFLFRYRVSFDQDLAAHAAIVASIVRSARGHGGIDVFAGPQTRGGITRVYATAPTDTIAAGLMAGTHRFDPDVQTLG